MTFIASVGAGGRGLLLRPSSRSKALLLFQFLDPPLLASQAESSSNRFNWKSWRPRQGGWEGELGKLVTLGGWVILILTATTPTTGASCGGMHGKCTEFQRC